MTIPLRWLMIYSGFHLALLFAVLPLSFFLASFMAWGLGFVSLERGRPWPSWLVQSLAGVGFVLTFALVRPYFGLENSACLAAWVLAFQVHLLKQSRARWAQLFVCLFALSIFLVNDVSGFSFLIMMVDLVLFFALMMNLQGEGPTIGFQSLRSAFRLVLLTLPIWGVLFFFFPRFTLSLWAGPPSAAQAGFSDELRPGQIGKVVLRDDVAFRFQMNSSRGERNLYFRGGILNEPKRGLHWVRGAVVPETVKPGPSPTALQVWIEPRWGKALFVLDYAERVELVAGFDSVQFIENQGAASYQLPSAIRRLATYRTYSTGSAKGLKPPGPAEIFLPLQVREDLDSSPEVRELLQTLAGVASEARVVPILSTWFRQKQFRYDLEPPPLANEDLSIFLTETKIGFCEHYAAAAATLLRASGIPARVVIGFLGGRFNVVSGEHVMYDRDAHAWTEFYDSEEKTWVRFDLTSYIQPLRFTIGSEIYRMTAEDLEQGTWSEPGVDLTTYWEAWTHAFERRILFYENQWLRDLLLKLNIPARGVEALTLVFGLALLTIMALLLVAVRKLFEQHVRQSPSERLLNSVRKHFAVAKDEDYSELQLQTVILSRLTADRDHQHKIRSWFSLLLAHRYSAHPPSLLQLKKWWKLIQLEIPSADAQNGATKDPTRQAASEPSTPASKPMNKG